MGYRIDEHPKPRPHRELKDTTTPATITVHNGTIAHLAFPCWYQEVHKPLRAYPHNKHVHDHFGWPGPDNPDNSCQLWLPALHCCSIGKHHECSPHCRNYIDLDGLFPIHLLNEGYTGFEVSFQASEVVPTDADIQCEATVDPEEDWVVRVTLYTHDQNALDEPMRYKMTVFAIMDTGYNKTDRRDIVALTDLVILPAGYETE